MSSSAMIRKTICLPATDATFTANENGVQLLAWVRFDHRGALRKNGDAGRDSSNS